MTTPATLLVDLDWLQTWSSTLSGSTNLSALCQYLQKRLNCNFVYKGVFASSESPVLARLSDDRFDVQVYHRKQCASCCAPSSSVHGALWFQIAQAVKHKMLVLIAGEGDLRVPLHWFKSQPTPTLFHLVVPNLTGVSPDIIRLTEFRDGVIQFAELGAPIFNPNRSDSPVAPGITAPKEDEPGGPDAGPGAGPGVGPGAAEPSAVPFVFQPVVKNSVSPASVSLPSVAAGPSVPAVPAGPIASVASQAPASSSAAPVASQSVQPRSLLKHVNELRASDLMQPFASFQRGTQRVYVVVLEKDESRRMCRVEFGDGVKQEKPFSELEFDAFPPDNILSDYGLPSRAQMLTDVNNSILGIKPAPPAPISADPATPSAPQAPQAPLVSNPVVWLDHTTLSVNQKLDVKDRVGMWLPAELVQIDGSNYKFHFHGWDPKWDETFDMSVRTNQHKIANFKQFSDVDNSTVQPLEIEDLVAFKLDSSETVWNRGRVIQFKNRLQIKVQFLRGTTQGTRWFHIVADAARLVIFPHANISAVPFDDVDDSWSAVGKPVSIFSATLDKWVPALVVTKNTLLLPDDQRMTIIKVHPTNVKNDKRDEWLDWEMADAQRIRYQK